jgi:hypothetical protein
MEYFTLLTQGILIGILTVQIFNMNKELTKLRLHLLFCFYFCVELINWWVSHFLVEAPASIPNKRKPSKTGNLSTEVDLHNFWCSVELQNLLLLLLLLLLLFLWLQVFWLKVWVYECVGTKISTLYHMLMASQLIYKVNRIVEPWQLITMFSRPHAWSLAWNEPNQSLAQTDTLLLSDMF